VGLAVDFDARHAYLPVFAGLAIMLFPATGM
jgi:hypothetical protein